MVIQGKQFDYVPRDRQTTDRQAATITECITNAVLSVHNTI